MKTKPRNRLGQLLAISMIAVFFAWLFPSTEKIVLFKNAADVFWGLPTEIYLPFATNKILNVLLVIAFCYVIGLGIKYLDRPKHRSNEAIVGVIYGLLFGLITGVWLMVVGSINYYVELVFGIGLLIVLVIEIMATLEDNIASGLKLGLATALTMGIIIGLMVGLKTNFMAGAGVSLLVAAVVTTITGVAVIIIGFLKSLFQRKTWDTIFSLLNGPSFND